MKPGLKLERGKNGGDLAAIGMHLEEPGEAVIHKPKDDPTPIWRVGTSDCSDVSTLVVR